MSGQRPTEAGPATPHGTLVEYLVLALDTICGHWLREGELRRNPGTLDPRPTLKAQAAPPRPWLTGARLPGADLPISIAGPPVAGFCDAVATEGSDGVIRALLSVGGNPVSAWPDQHAVVRALGDLELLVQVDAWMSQTAKLAHYVIPPMVPLEVPSYAGFGDGYGAGYGATDAYAQYTPAVVAPPAGSDVIEEWRFFYALAQRMGLRLEAATGNFVIQSVAGRPVEIDMVDPPTTDELLEALAANARIPLAEVKRHPHGASFPDPPMRVGPKDPGWTARLDVGNAEVLAGLSPPAGNDTPTAPTGYTLICRRHMHVYNSSGNVLGANRGRAYNPAFFHPDDLVALGVGEGEPVAIRSLHGAAVAFAHADKDLRRGVVSIAHGYGDLPNLEDPVTTGANVNRLVGTRFGVERFTGQTPMSNIPVEVVALTAYGSP